MNMYLEQTRFYIQNYKDSDNKESVLEMIASDDLAVIEELLKIIIDQEHWIKDAKDIIKRG